MQAVIDKAVSYPTRLAVAGIFVDDSGIPIKGFDGCEVDAMLGHISRSFGIIPFKHNFIVRTVLRVASLFVQDTVRRLPELGGCLYLRIAGYCTNRPCRLVPAHQGMKMRLGRWKCLGVVGATLPLWIPAPYRGTGHAFDRRNDEFGGGNHSSRIGVRDMLSYQSPMPAAAGTPRYENWVHWLMEGSGVVCATHPAPSWGQAPALHFSLPAGNEPQLE